MSLRAATDCIIRINDRAYRWPTAPLVVVCLDGSSYDYLQAAFDVGVAPYLASLVAAGRLRMGLAAMPTFTNPNNVSIVTGVPPARHGISGNFWLDLETGRAVQMTSATCLRAETILAAFCRAGATAAAVTAKDKLRALLGAGLNGVCVSAEQEGCPVYSARLSHHVLTRGIELMRRITPDLLYLSTSDYVQHAYAPGSARANAFYERVDEALAELDRTGATIVVTADHGMHSKADADGRPHAVFLQMHLDEWFGTGAARVILPISDPYVRHHGSLGSFATIYLAGPGDPAEVVRRLRTLHGVELVLDRSDACRQLDLPADRIGDIVVCADAATVLGARQADHDVSVLHGPLRSHGGLAEREVPIIFNRALAIEDVVCFHNYDAFWIGLNALE